jgi:hypothetical protein
MSHPQGPNDNNNNNNNNNNNIIIIIIIIIINSKVLPLWVAQPPHGVVRLPLDRPVLGGRTNGDG